jgi:hypothetical protein
MSVNDFNRYKKWVSIFSIQPLQKNGCLFLVAVVLSNRYKKWVSIFSSGCIKQPLQKNNIFCSGCLR